MTDTTQTELLPCPFCGGKPYITIEHCTDGSTFVFAFVKCSCGAKSPEKGFTQGNDCPQLYAEVRELWNTRQPTGVAAEAVLQISDELVNRLRKPEHSIRAPLDDTRAIATPPTDEKE